MVAELSHHIDAQTDADKVDQLSIMLYNHRDREEIWTYCLDHNLPTSGTAVNAATLYVAHMLDLPNPFADDPLAWEPDETTSEAVAAYWEKLPDFDPNQTLFLDLEGDVAISFYWPANGAHRGSTPADPTTDPAFLFHPAVDETTRFALEDFVGRKAEEIETVVVYCKVREDVDERSRLIEYLGTDLFPDSKWITLDPATAQTDAHELRKLMRETPGIKMRLDPKKGNKGSRSQNCLEAVERAFGLTRDVAHRSSKYRDHTGTPGKIEQIIGQIKSLTEGQNNTIPEEDILMYCIWDVWSMYEISCRAQEIAAAE
jgi:hypothetical protein